MVLNVYEAEQRIEDLSARLAAIEDQLARVSEKVNVPYEKPSATVPPEVVELTRAGNRIEAMKRYRELTNASREQAQQVLARI